MRVEIKDLSEEDVVLISVMLDDAGFEYDTDYTTLYGAGWAVTGVRIMNPRANALVAEAFARWTMLPRLSASIVLSASSALLTRVPLRLGHT